MVLKLIKHLSPAYVQMLHLRKEVLLLPIGIPASYIKPAEEFADLLIGAFEGDKLIGCCVLTPRNDKEVQLRQMAVGAGFQGKGIGAAIIAFAEQTAFTNGYYVVFLHARNDVISFYIKCGYQIAGAEFFEVSIGHHRMEKLLT